MSRLGWVRRVVPVSTPALVMWAWRNRQELGAWGRFGTRALGRVMTGDVEDVVAELRLRAALTLDARTRGGRGLIVDVRNGEAVLSGTVTPEIRQAATNAARRTRGIRSVRDLTKERTPRGAWLRRSRGA